MDYIKQALNMSDTNKNLAIKLYKEAVSQLANKNYIFKCADAHTELSAIFGVKWMLTKDLDDFFWLNKDTYAEANVAFNYANCMLGARNKFISLAKTLVADEERISNNQLSLIANQLNFLLTTTTSNMISPSLRTKFLPQRNKH